MSYLTFDVLELEPNRIGNEAGAIGRSMGFLDSKTGAVDVEDRSATPILEREYEWTLTDRPGITVLRTFITTRRGRAIPFWCPSWQSDLTPTQALTTGQTALIVKEVGYTGALFPYNARKHLALILADGTIYTRGVSNSVDNGNGTETLTLNSSLPEDFPATGSLVSFLMLCRLDDDGVLVEWDTRDIAKVTLKMVELPREAPAP